MPRSFARLLALASVIAIPSLAFAQQPPPSPLLKLGDAVVTGFSGTVAPDPRRPRPPNKSAADLTFIDPDGPSLRVIDVSRPGHVWEGRVFAAPKTFSAAARDVGQVFGVALDDQTPPNIYAAATSAFGLNLVARDRSGQFERRKKGGPGTGWMRGQFGLDLQGGPGAIYRIDGRTGVISLFANVTLDGVPNPAPALGNLAYDAAHKQLFVSDLYTGMIHRFDLDGRDLGRFDHGVTALTAARQTPVPFDPRNRPNIASTGFDAERPVTWGYAPSARRVWGLAVHGGRLYYAVVSGPQIWSVGIARDGSFADDPRWETDLPAQAGPLPVSDIAFSQRGAMILAQRAVVAASYDYSAFVRPGEPQVFRLWLKGPNDPPSPGRWKVVPEEYAVGFAGTHRNTNGGVALGYGYDSNSALTAAGCEYTLWTTGQNLRNAPPLRSELEPGGPLVLHGLQAAPSSPVRDFNAPPWTSYFVGYADRPDEERNTGHLGGVRILTQPCASPTAYGGPGAPGSPPYTVVTVGPPPICIGPNCPPPPQITDLEIKKIGETNLNNPNGPYNFTIGVTNLGGAITTPTTLTFTDVVPAGMTFTNVTASNWTCGPPPVIPAGGTLTCTYNGPFPIAANQSLGWVTVVATGGAGPFENCASLGQPDGNTSNDKACVTVQSPTVDVKLEKKITDRSGPHTWFDIEVTNVGGPISNGAFTVVDDVPAGMTVMSVAGPWSCAPVPVTSPNQLTCTYSAGSVPANTVLPAIKLTTIGGTQGWQNCATVAVNTISGTDNNPLNDKGCVSDNPDPVGELIVVKKVVYSGPLIMPSLTYPVTVTCGAWSKTFNLINNVPQSEGNVPQVSCLVTETLPPAPASACEPGKVATWQTPPSVAPSNPFTPTGITTTVTVTNTLDCLPGDQGGTGSLTVSKQVMNNTSPQISTNGIVFPISVSCQSGTSPAVVTPMPLNDQGSQTISGLALGTGCTVTEGPPGPFPPQPFLCMNGMVPTWTKSFVPSDQVNITGNHSVTVQNILECKPEGGGGGDGQKGYMRVEKVIDNKANASLSALQALTFPVTVTCGGNATPVNVKLTQAGVVTGIPVTTTCSALEGPLPPAPAGSCPSGQVATWIPPETYTPASVTISSGAGPVITIKNTLECRPEGGGGGQRTSLLVTKSVVNNTGAPTPPGTFPLAITCTPPAGAPLVFTASIANGGSAQATQVPVGSSCIVEEPTPLDVQNACVAGASWTVSYAPQQTVVLGNSPQTVTVTNTLNCKGPPPPSIAPPPPPPTPVKCTAPLIPDGAGKTCVCPAGMRKRGNTCVKQVVCHAPAQLNKAGTACVLNCPRGTVKRGNTCVRREQPKKDGPRVTPNDVIRVVPGLIGPGGFGGGGVGGGGGDRRGGGGGAGGPAGVR